MSNIYVYIYSGCCKRLGTECFPLQNLARKAIINVNYCQSIEWQRKLLGLPDVPKQQWPLPLDRYCSREEEMKCLFLLGLFPPGNRGS